MDDVARALGEAIRWLIIIAVIALPLALVGLITIVVLAT